MAGRLTSPQLWISTCWEVWLREVCTEDCQKREVWNGIVCLVLAGKKTHDEKKKWASEGPFLRIV